MITNKMLTLQGALYGIAGTLTPVLTILQGSAALTPRTIAVMIIGGVLGGVVAIKAFLSTTYAESPAAGFSKRS